MVQCLAGRVFCKPDGRCSIALGIAIDEKGRLFRGGQTSGQINGSGGFAYTALLVCTSDDSCQMFPHAKLNKRCGQLQVVSRGTAQSIAVSFEDHRLRSDLDPIVGPSTFNSPICDKNRVSRETESRNNRILQLLEACFTWNALPDSE